VTNRARKPRRLSPAAYVQGILEGDRLMLSRAITLVESTLASDRELANEILEACLPHTGKSYRLGITGVPGVGKSTFIDAFGSLMVEKGKKLAVLAIDPSSAKSQGSILGDKTRMNRLSHHPKAFIRPSPTGGSLGGVARKTRESLLLCEAAGYDLVIIETVGVGQSETTVHAMVDFFLLLMLPNAGDDLQGIKKGIMEMADGLVINKADGEFLPKARMARANYTQALRIFQVPESGWRPKVLLASALEKQGLSEVWQMLEEYRADMTAKNFWQKRRGHQALQWMRDALQLEVENLLAHDPQIQLHRQELEKAVQEQKRAPIQAANDLIQLWLTHLKSQQTQKPS
jgi:LAO/AO transport system kinase